MLPAFGDNDPATITTDQVQAWIGGLELAPVSVKKYAATLRTILDYAGVDPNPARDQRIRLPREQRSVVEPPSMVEVEVIIDYAPARYRLLLRVLAETGMRVGEVCALEWRDVDASGSRFRIREGKTAAARRWVAVPEPLMMELDAATPPDDRTPQRRVFGGATPSGVKSMLARVCKNAGIAHYHPPRSAPPIRLGADQPGRPGYTRRSPARPQPQQPHPGRLQPRPARRLGATGEAPVMPQASSTSRKAFRRATRAFRCRWRPSLSGM
jgi:integrase